MEQSCPARLDVTLIRALLGGDEVEGNDFSRLNAESGCSMVMPTAQKIRFQLRENFCLWSAIMDFSNVDGRYGPVVQQQELRGAIEPAELVDLMLLVIGEALPTNRTGAGELDHFWPRVGAVGSWQKLLPICDKFHVVWVIDPTEPGNAQSGNGMREFASIGVLELVGKGCGVPIAEKVEGFVISTNHRKRPMPFSPGRTDSSTGLRSPVFGGA